MIWQTISPIWQACAEEAWEAYCHRSLPHGAVIVDEGGKIVGRGRNRIREQVAEGRQIARNRLAHAELNALLQMDWYSVNVYGCKLYSVVEPCPMCIGAVCMAHMHEVHYASRDGGAGASSLVDKTEFFRSVGIKTFGAQDPVLEILFLAIQVEATYSQAHPNPDAWVNLLTREVPVAAVLGKSLFESHVLDQWKAEGKEASFVLDQVHEQFVQLQHSPFSKEDA